MRGDRKPYRRDFGRKVNVFRDADVALLDGAFHVDILDLLAEIGLGRDKANQAVLDLEIAVCSVSNDLVRRARGLYRERFAAVARSA